MRRHIWAGFIASALVLSGTYLPLYAGANSSNIERAVVSLDEPVRMLGAVLRPGRYLFLHHNGTMERGLPCMFVYTLDSPNEGNRVVSFHCSSVVRPRAVEFKLVIRKVQGDLPEATEVQFAGTAEGHLVPDHEAVE